MRRIILKKEYIYQGNLILVNGKNEIKQNSNDCDLKQYNNVILNYNVVSELEKILKEINNQNQIVLVSGYRSLEEQKSIWNNSLKENGEEFTKKYIAYPNCSEHQTGLAIDLGLNSDKLDFIRPAFPYTGICQRFRELAVQYGFIERYKENKENITGIANEEWHFRYVGYPHSEIIQKMGFCLEEYINYLKDFTLGQSSLLYNRYEISYVKMDEDIKEIYCEDDEIVTISGNNVDGIIITKTIVDVLNK